MLVPVGEDVSGGKRQGEEKMSVGGKDKVMKPCRRVHTEIDITETAATNLTTDTVFVTDAKVLLQGQLVRREDSRVKQVVPLWSWLR
jgi:hypothetical protein